MYAATPVDSFGGQSPVDQVKDPCWHWQSTALEIITLPKKCFEAQNFSGLWYLRSVSTKFPLNI